MTGLHDPETKRPTITTQDDNRHPLFAQPAAEQTTWDDRTSPFPFSLTHSSNGIYALDASALMR
jgi:hypothetical protein